MILSSIFSFNEIRRYQHIPRSEKHWHLLLGGSGVLCLVLCSFVLRYTFTAWPLPSVHQMAYVSISKNTEIVFLGASLVRTDINPDCFQRGTVNLSVDGGDYQSAEILLKCNLDGMPNLKLAVIQIDNLVQFYDRLAQSDLTQLYEQGVPVYSIPGLSRLDRIIQRLKSNALMQPFIYLDRLTPQSLIKRSRRFPGEIRPGHQTLNISLNEDELARRDLNQDEALLQSTAITANRTALFRMIDLLQARNISVLLLRYPQIRQYADAKSDSFNAAYQDLLASVCNRYGSKLHYWDFIYAPGIELQDFSDTRHLNTAGARTFSYILAERIENVFFHRSLPHHKMR